MALPLPIQTPDKSRIDIEITEVLKSKPDATLLEEFEQTSSTAWTGDDLDRRVEFLKDALQGSGPPRAAARSAGWCALAGRQLWAL